MSPANRRIAVLLGAFIVAYLTQYALFLLAWLYLGGAALAGTITAATVLGWAAATAASLTCRVGTTRLQTALAIAAGERLRRRLLRGALHLDPSTIRREGTGHLLGRILETESLEDLATGGALRGLAAALELALAATVLTAALGPIALALLLGWLAATGIAAHRYTRARLAWTAARITLGNDLTEKIAGHRTRAVQQRPERLHDGEDAALTAYENLAAAMDRRITILTVVMPRGWAVTGVALLAAHAATAATPTTLAAGVASILFSFGALAPLSAGLAGLADAHCAWSQLRPLLPVEDIPIPVETDGRQTADHHIDAGLIEAEKISYRYPGRDRSALCQADLRVDAGDRILIQGPSGSGKSTLAAILASAQAPTTGHLRLRGTDIAAVGPAAWRRHVLTVPQSDHNHLVLGTLAMNLLIGRRWPATPHDLAAAERVCRSLGLGDLIDRMPSGLAQIIGETGWQLSHGERSLVFLARALLQDAELLILDETFGALDPRALHNALNVTIAQAPTLLVIRQ